MRFRSCLAWALLAAGCGTDPVERAFAAHTRELEERAGIAPPSGPRPVLVRPYPEPRVRAIEIEPARIGVFDFLSIADCELQGYAARRTSALGRVMQPSQRLVHELGLLRAARACLEASEDPLRERLLSDLLRTKQRDLRAVFWNATFGGPELARFFTAVPPLGFGEEIEGLDALEDLLALRERLEPGSPLIDSAEVETPLATLARVRDGGALLQSLDLLASHLDRQSDALGRLAGDERCDLVADEERLIAYARRVGAQGRRLLGTIDVAWRDLEPVAPESFVPYLRSHLSAHHPRSLWSRFAAAHAQWHEAHELCRVTLAFEVEAHGSAAGTLRAFLPADARAPRPDETVLRDEGSRDGELRRGIRSKARASSYSAGRVGRGFDRFIEVAVRQMDLHSQRPGSLADTADVELDGARLVDVEVALSQTMSRLVPVERVGGVGQSEAVSSSRGRLLG